MESLDHPKPPGLRLIPKIWISILVLMNFSQNSLRGKIDLRLVLIVTLIGSVISLGEGHPTGVTKSSQKKETTASKAKTSSSSKTKTKKTTSVLNKKVHQCFQQEDFESLEQDEDSQNSRSAVVGTIPYYGNTKRSGHCRILQIHSDRAVGR